MGKQNSEGLNIAGYVNISRPLILMQAVPFTVAELKILDTYMSQIDPSHVNSISFIRERKNNRTSCSCQARENGGEMGKQKSEGLDIEGYVNKSRPLILMQAVPFTLAELKILDIYLSRIDPNDPNSREVTYTKADYERLIGLRRCKVETLQSYIEHLMKPVQIPCENEGDFDLVPLFEKAEFRKVAGQYTITMRCHEDVKRYFFGDIKQIGVLRYRLKNVLPLTSVYSIWLYYYLRDNASRKEWMATVDQLKRDVFRCADDPYYAEYKRFSEKILVPSLKEVNELTDLTYSVLAANTGKYVTHIHFTLIEDRSLAFGPEYSAENDCELWDYLNEEYKCELEDLSATLNHEFDEGQLQVLIGTIPCDIRCDYTVTYNWCYKLYQEFCQIASQAEKKGSPIKNRYAYFKSMLLDRAEKYEQKLKSDGDED